MNLAPPLREEDPNSRQWEPKQPPVEEPGRLRTATTVQEKAFLKAVEDLPYVSEAYLRPLTTEEAANVTEPARMLMALVIPGKPTWLRAEVVVTDTAIANEDMHAPILEYVQTSITQGLPTLLLATNQRVRRGDYKRKPKD